MEAPKLWDWIQTYSGKAFVPMDPKARDVCLDDIAHALSMQCRYAGHCRRFYSVAEHCVLMSREVSVENQLWALMHDASEAYLVDVPRPLKPFLVGYKEIETKCMGVIAKRFGLKGDIPEEVKRADNAILRDECEQNMSTPPADWNLPPAGLGVTLQFWSPERAKAEFLDAAFFAVVNQTLHRKEAA